jgi:hypothetical protein
MSTVVADFEYGCPSMECVSDSVASCDDYDNYKVAMHCQLIELIFTKLFKYFPRLL